MQEIRRAFSREEDTNQVPEMSDTEDMRKIQECSNKYITVFIWCDQELRSDELPIHPYSVVTSERSA